MPLKIIINSLIILTGLIITNVNAREQSETLFIDKSIQGSELFQFPNDDKSYPDQSDFIILHSLFMSNEVGERWATLTIKNNAAGRRMLTRKHLMALFANGARRHPIMNEQDFKAQEVISVTISFGLNKYPILQIISRQ
ncbi:hypothetical protein [Aliikangiella maris]|uniref:Uncharacterized protein n=2 Tax=Aliikangiella maris TaxID=3162458 RepID=A0ABV3MIV6_9GAMM